MKVEKKVGVTPKKDPIALKKECYKNARKLYWQSYKVVFINMATDTNRYFSYIWNIIKITFLLIPFYLITIPVMGLFFWLIWPIYLPIKASKLFKKAMALIECPNVGGLLRYKIKRRKNSVIYSLESGIIFESYKSKGKYVKVGIADCSDMLPDLPSHENITRGYVTSLLKDLELFEDEFCNKKTTKNKKRW